MKHVTDRLDLLILVIAWVIVFITMVEWLQWWAKRPRRR
jgi:hypothetical protein